MSVSALQFMLDTNIVSALMRDTGSAVHQRIAERLAATPTASLCTSVIVQCELLFGLRRRGNARLLRRYDEAMQMLHVHPLALGVAEHYAALRTQLEAAGNPIGPNDTLIAAHALALGATLVTADAEFARVPGLAIENWLI